MGTGQRDDRGWSVLCSFCCLVFVGCLVFLTKCFLDYSNPRDLPLCVGVLNTDYYKLI